VAEPLDHSETFFQWPGRPLRLRLSGRCDLLFDMNGVFRDGLFGKRFYGWCFANGGGSTHCHVSFRTSQWHNRNSRYNDSQILVSLIGQATELPIFPEFLKAAYLNSR
jgi:hypothetical protein